MSLIQGNTKVSAGGYSIGQSIRFNDDDSPRLTKTLGTATDNTAYTVSFWLKRGTLGTAQYIFSGGTSGTATEDFWRFETSNKMGFRWAGTDRLITTQVFRDPSSFYHFVLAVDFNASGSDKAKLYVNGAEVTAFDTDSRSSLSVTNVKWNQAENHTISGFLTTGGSYFDGYISEFNFVDGQQLAPTDFGEYNDDGVWIAKKFAGTYGTNGFYITGADSADLGADESGNSNDFTSSGLTSDDQVTDTPTNNKLAWNGLQNQRSAGDVSGITYKYTGSTRTLCGTTIHIPPTGKWIAAFSASSIADSDWQIGLLGSTDTDFGDATGSNEDVRVGFGPYSGSQYLAKNNTVASWYTGVTEDVNDTIWIAVDADNDEQWAGVYDDSASAMVWFGSGGTSGDIATRTNPTDTGYIAAVGSVQFCACARDSVVLTLLDIEDAPGYSSIPTDYKSLSSANLPAPTIKDGSAYFQTTLYTGTGSALEINQTGNSTFQPDFVWAKSRSAAQSHRLADAVRGSAVLFSDSTAAEDTTAGISFDADGFSWTNSDGSNANDSGKTYAAWQWLAGNGTATNEDGSINSTVSVNQTSGFSIATFTAPASGTFSVGHGLGAVPKFTTLKRRDSATGGNWQTWHIGLGDNLTDYIFLSTSGAEASYSTMWGTDGRTSSVCGFTIGGSATGNGTYVLYSFAEVPGFSKFGSYTGNGSTDGPFVWCGFRPAFVIAKRTNSADNWAMYDAVRDSYNVAEKYLYADVTNAEATFSTAKIDFLSNGFKWRGAVNFGNASGGTYIFMAFAEHPFGGTDVAPVPAR